MKRRGLLTFFGAAPLPGSPGRAQPRLSFLRLADEVIR
jgi:hypothetical protein